MTRVSCVPLLVTLIVAWNHSRPQTWVKEKIWRAGEHAVFAHTHNLEKISGYSDPDVGPPNIFIVSEGKVTKWIRKNQLKILPKGCKANKYIHIAIPSHKGR